MHQSLCWVVFLQISKQTGRTKKWKRAKKSMARAKKLVLFSYLGHVTFHPDHHFYAKLKWVYSPRTRHVLTFLPRNFVWTVFFVLILFSLVPCLPFSSQKSSTGTVCSVVRTFGSIRFRLFSAPYSFFYHLNLSCCFCSCLGSLCGFHSQKIYCWACMRPSLNSPVFFPSLQAKPQ